MAAIRFAISLMKEPLLRCGSKEGSDGMSSSEASSNEARREVGLELAGNEARPAERCASSLAIAASRLWTSR